ncbi:sensor histidine kinase [Thalassospira marina]|uniref:histidine kinase n=1 Tax=Thalassospira marina TaxID=2048283 RepID=A0ABM6QFB1_9PROT|nr:sensor histidine kinase KdpD [Thalassospira marina]AUG55290.1 two-component sensor histidine kinase [Thalassospira marina]
MTDEEDRPSPEALLEQTRKDERGKLKIFLGAYPGVGKTYAMLQAAQERRKEGRDVIVGIVETHGRVETENLLRGLEALPRKRLLHRGRVFGEMDIDAIIWRKPEIALVDELAHTNVPGSRHEKRYQDIDELLDAGINVYTTLNIQHLESLNDIVARISRVRVRETLPDSFLEKANEIELIDLPPDDLLQRLRDGKVYVIDQVGRALRHFFSKGNLTALRELAMRIAAERIDAQMLEYMRTHAVSGPWPTQERLMVCLNESPVAKKLVRTAKRMAERQRIPWIALHVETPRDDRMSNAEKDDIAEALRLAEQLGAEIITLQAEVHLAREISALAAKRNVTRLLIGRPRRRSWTGLLRENVARKLLENAEGFDVTVIAVDADEKKRSLISDNPFEPGTWRSRSLLWVFGSVTAATVAALFADRYLPFGNLSLIYLLAVLLTAIRCSMWPSIATSFLSFISYNFFFTIPYYTLSVFHQEQLITIVFFLIVSVIVGNLAGRLRLQVDAMKTSGKRTANLYDFSRKIAAAASLDDVLWAAVHHVAATLDCQSMVLQAGKDGALEITAAYPPEDQLGLKDWGAAEWAWEHSKPAGWRSETLPTAEWLFMPMTTQQGPLGVLGVRFNENARTLGPAQRRLLEALVDQVAVAVERTRLATDMEEARLLSEAEQLRAALLSSVSHDLRTPLVSIIGSATTLSSYGDRMGPDDRTQLTQTILEESERLNRFVQNLLDMTRLGYGALQPKKEWSDLAEIIGRAVKHVRKYAGSRSFDVQVSPDLSLIQLDPVLIEQVLFNVLDNAVKHTTNDGRINVSAKADKTRMIVEISDNGPGIPAEARQAVFDVFYRVRAGDSQVAGTGLGLSICRGFIEAHGGHIVALDGPQGSGTTIAITLPMTEVPTVAEDDEDLQDGCAEGN